MGYVAVKGGTDAIASAKDLVEYYRLRNLSNPVELEQIQAQFRLALDKIMGEGGFYDPEYAAIAFKQAEGDVLEAAFILRAFRATLQRNYYGEIDTREMFVRRRISASFREIPGGQILGPTKDYTQRLLKTSMAGESLEEIKKTLSSLEALSNGKELDQVHTFGKVIDLLKREGLLKPVTEDEDRSLVDITHQAVRFPAPRSARLQMLARAETGGIMALAYSSMRGFEGVHPTVGELRYGSVRVHVKDASGRRRYIGKVEVTEAEMITRMRTDKKNALPYFSIGYGLCFGQNDTKAICMGILDRTLRNPEGNSPVNDQEYVLYHTDGIDAMGFTNHLKLPHYVTFQSGLDNLRRAIAQQEQQAVSNGKQDHSDHQEEKQNKSLDSVQDKS